MTTLTPDQDGIVRTAGLSSDGLYRWWLTRRWSDAGPWVHFVMLNPSTADGQSDDATIRRVMGFAKGWGFAGVVVTNLFAFRATDPTVLWENRHRHGLDHVVGRLGDQVITQAARAAAYTVCGWGADRQARLRAAAVLSALRVQGSDVRALRVTRSGAPAHPLYLPASLVPVAYTTEMR